MARSASKEYCSSLNMSCRPSAGFTVSPFSPFILPSFLELEAQPHNTDSSSKGMTRITRKFCFIVCLHSYCGLFRRRSQLETKRLDDTHTLYSCQRNMYWFSSNML